MPIYEYQCDACQHLFETLQKMSDDPLTTCPACGKEALTKLISASQFHLKGEGWYVTDFKDDNKSKTDHKSGDAKTNSGKTDKSTESTDSKIEATDKKESKPDTSAKTETKPTTAKDDT